MWEILQGVVDRTRSRLDLKVVKTIFGFKRRPRVKRLKKNQWGVDIETPVYDLTVFHVHYGKLSLKIYSQGESVLRIEVMVHNAQEAPFGRRLENFPKTVVWMKEVAERFLNTLHCVEVCFIGDETLEQLPAPSVVGQTRVGGVDTNQLRMRLAMRAAIALATSPKGFTARDVANKVGEFGGLDTYNSRQAPYDLKKLRGKLLIQRKGTSRRYESSPQGLRAMVGLVVIRDEVIKPLLASQGRLKSGRRPVKTAPVDAHYAALRHAMRDLFHELKIAA